MSDPDEVAVLPALSTLDTQAKLADIRMRVLAGEQVSPMEYRQLLDDLRSDREATAKASAKASREVRKANKSTTTPDSGGDLTLDKLF